ncbi:MAG: hypothetical protein IPP26_08275 [Flavobacteriales bacterium]|nr:hypothetical protein [Flavobacteriales bacterium]
MTLNALGDHEAGAALCQEIIEKHDGAREAPIVYVTYGNCMDQMGRPEASLKVYDKGISVLPNLAMLHFNKGITLTGMGPDSAAAAMKCFERSSRLDPYHPGTQNAMARLLAREDRNIPATMTVCRFLILSLKVRGPREPGLVAAPAEREREEECQRQHRDPRGRQHGARQHRHHACGQRFPRSGGGLERGQEHGHGERIGETARAVRA